MPSLTLLQEDCLKAMKSLPDESINLILCDLPYGTTAYSWDKRIPFEPLWNEYKRVLTPNGTALLFASGFFLPLLMGSQAEKPLPLLDYLIRTYSNVGDTVLDNCMGSGSTGEAALKCGRKFVGMEIDESFFNTAKQRLESLK